MKKVFLAMAIVMAMLLTSQVVQAQAPTGNIANVTQLKQKWPEKGSRTTRDSLIAIYNDMVIRKNEYILSHREYSHFYTPSNQDYFIVEEYKDMAAMEKANDMNTELEKKGWPDEAKRKAFMEAMGAYFENWHGDAIYSTNPKLSKN